MKNILFISHFFPPTGGSGVQRSTKFVKHLIELGFNPVVISSWIEKKNKWTPSDDSFAKEIPPSVKVRRLPDNKQFAVLSNTRLNPLRNGSILNLGKALVKSEQIEIVYVSLSPFGDLEAAIAIGKETGLPVVADLRDPWALDEFQTHRSWYHKKKELKRMRTQLNRCDHIIMNTPDSASLLCKQFREIPRSKVSWITNGYDEDDFSESEKKHVLNEKFYNIVHTGTFHTDYACRQKRQKLLNYLLGRTTSGLNVLGRTPNYLLLALDTIRRDHPRIFNQIRVTFAGVASEDDLRLVQRYGMDGTVNFTGYISHESCIQYTKEANMLFLPLHSLAAGKRCSIVPGKTYEYMASNATILGALPEGDARDFVKQRSNCHLSPPDDAKSMAKSILIEVKRWQSKEQPPQCRHSFSRRFERKVLAEQLAQTFRSVLA